MQDGYDDGGFSGATLERAALRRLLADVEAGRVDIIVTYKLDRLSRSLLIHRVPDTMTQSRSVT